MKLLSESFQSFVSVRSSLTGTLLKASSFSIVRGGSFIGAGVSNSRLLEEFLNTNFGVRFFCFGFSIIGSLDLTFDSFNNIPEIQLLVCKWLFLEGFLNIKVSGFEMMKVDCSLEDWSWRWQLLMLSVCKLYQNYLNRYLESFFGREFYWLEKKIPSHWNTLIFDH